MSSGCQWTSTHKLTAAAIACVCGLYKIKSFNILAGIGEGAHKLPLLSHITEELQTLVDSGGRTLSYIQGP